MKDRFLRIAAISCAAFLLLNLAAIEAASARGGRGGGGRVSAGGGARSSGGFRSGGASPRMNSSVNLQNRGNFSSPSRDRSQMRSNYQGSGQSGFQNRQGSRQDSFGQTRQSNQQTRQQNQQDRQSNRQQNQQNRQNNSQQNQQNRQATRENRQSERTERTDIRQNERTDRANTRQNEITNRQQNRQNYLDDNWYGGGWYGGGYYVPPGWGWVGFTSGLIIGATVASPPPYYQTVYTGTSSYIYSDGVYMEPQGSSYVIVAPPEGAVVTYLPDGCTATVVNNTQYFNCSDVYYQPFYQNGATVYRVVRL